VDAGLLGEIDELAALPAARIAASTTAARLAGDGDDRAVVIRVERVVEQAHALDLHRRDDLAHDFGIDTLREVGDALENGEEFIGSEIMLYFHQV
jgi:hypothetical protein